jgi:hypothetical protein
MDSRWSEALKTLDLVLLLQQPAKDKVVTTVGEIAKLIRRLIYRKAVRVIERKMNRHTLADRQTEKDDIR